MFLNLLSLQKIYSMKRIISIFVVSGFLGFLWITKLIDYKNIFSSNIFIGIFLIVYVLLMSVWTAVWVDGLFEFFKKPSKEEAFRSFIHLLLLPVSPFIIIYTIFEELYYHEKNNNKKSDSDNNSNLSV